MSAKHGVRMTGWVLLVLLMPVLVVGCGDNGSSQEATDDGPTPPADAEEVVVRSDAFVDEGTIPDRYTCDGEDVSPPLAWERIPEEAAEVAIIVTDPDAPEGPFVHWVVGGLDPADGELEEGTVPAEAVEGSNDFGDQGYGGPCPPPGDPAHRYVVTVYAADAPLRLEPGAPADEVHAALQDRVVARGQLVGTYRR